MKTIKISDEMRSKCEAVIEQHVLKTRGWARDYYIIKFHVIDDDQNAALFTVVSHKALAEVRERMLAKPRKPIPKDLEDFGVLVDIIDFVCRKRAMQA